MSAERISLGSRLRAARPTGGASPTPSASSPSGDSSGEPVVPMSTLITRPTPVSRSPTAVEFHQNSDVWTSTPVRASQRTEFTEKMDYAFAYGEELAKLLRSHGFKSNVGLSLDGPDSETDFAVLLANMSHVFGPISRDEVFKLLDLDFEYEYYHYTINELIFSVLPTVLRGMALSLYEESAEIFPHDGRCALQRLRYQVEGIGDPDTHRFWVRLRSTVIDETIEPAPQLAVVRTLADKHRRLYPDYTDRSLVEDVYTVLRSSAAKSPYVTPLYLVVLRELSTNNNFTFASLTLRLGKVFRDESALARLSAPALPSSGGATRTGGGGGKEPAGSFHSLSRRKFIPPEGTWKKNDMGGRYLVWDGTGMPCVTCFRLWAVTTGHMDSDGICPYVCVQAFAPGRAPALAPRAPPKPPSMSAWPPSDTPQAHALRELEPAPQDAAPPPDAAALSVRFAVEPPPHRGIDPPKGAPTAYNDSDDDAPAALSIVQHEDDDVDWPAFRSTPWIPSFSGSGSGSSK
ncbi:hypothetical protein CYMTET_40135 [Cymbomonas tetramitiformis]|uniref:Uncharacterized protein n=1 Tax=Cymbomonas tetramitiformis TaxID=36881 RepID=A0AAE0CAH3_9CHLO|nr:hypothetical protein CYMTET_40135 [Cymbomonas tetramitiformis]